MSNEVAVIQQAHDSRSIVAAGVRPQALVPSDIEGVWRVAVMLAKAGMAPSGMDTAEKISVAIMAGLEIGLTPMQAMQSIAVVNGRPSIWGDAAAALVRGSGQCEFMREWIDGDGDAMKAFCEVKRKGDPSPIKREFTVADAMKAGLWDTREKITKRNRDGSSYEKVNDSPWYRYPKRMLQMRARGFCLRDAFPDVLRGVAIREEMEDVETVASQPALTKAPAPPTEVIEHSPSTAPQPTESHAEGNATGPSTAGEQPSAYEPEPEDETDWEALLAQFEAGLSKTAGQDGASEMLEHFLGLDMMPRDIDARAQTIFKNHLDALQSAHEKEQAKLAEQESAQRGAEEPAAEVGQSLADPSPSPVTKAPPPPSDDFPGDKPSKKSAAPKPPVDAEPTPAEKDIALAAQRDPEAIVRVMARKKAAAGTKKFNAWYKTISEADAAIVDAMPDLDAIVELAHNVDAGVVG